MARSSSAIMTEAQKARVEKQKGKEAAAKQKVKDQKAELKTLKADAADDKKAVAEEMKSFITSASKEDAVLYKNAVATHIKSVQAVSKLAAKLAPKEDSKED